MTAPKTIRGKRRLAATLTARALAAATTGDDQAAAIAVGRIISETGKAGRASAATAWCDAYLQHAPRLQHTKAVRGFFGLDDDAETIPPVARWTGQLITARATHDDRTFTRLLACLPLGAGAATYMFGLLDVVTRSQRTKRVGAS